MLTKVAVIFAIFLPVLTFSRTVKISDEKHLLPQVLNALEKVASFFASDYSSINVDGLYGIRVAQGQIKLTISECRSDTCGAGLMERLLALDKKMEDIADKALPYIEASDEKYFDRFKETILRPYIIKYNPLTIEPLEDQHVPNPKRMLYDEDKGDACYARLMGTYEENGIRLSKCNVTEECLEMMLHTNTARYVITHQLLYFIVLDHMGCKKSPYHEKGQIETIQKTFCTKIYKEAKSFVSKGNVEVSERDLFLEQTLLCGSLGFEDFMKPSWMKMVLRWPDRKDWCFRVEENDVVDIGEETLKNFVEENNIHNPKLLEELRHNIDELAAQQYFDFSENQTGSRASMRKPLREQAMKDSCLSHTTGLGMGVFGLYVRFLLRSM